MDRSPAVSPIDFESPENVVLLNPRMAPEQASLFQSWLAVASNLRGHIFVLTSGTTAAGLAGHKWVALSKQAVLASAKASNLHLDCTSRDVWLHSLPNHHVGGIGIWARAHTGGGTVVPAQSQWLWDAAQFASEAARVQATLASLVPAQVHDLSRLALPSPPSMRAILVGGGALSDELYLRARELGWPLLRTYGMSETASQIATETLADLDACWTGRGLRLRILPHLQASVGESGRLKIRGSSLLTGYVSLDNRGEPHFWDPKDVDGWFVSEDLGQVSDGRLVLEGRANDRIKIGGEITNLSLLRSEMERIAGAQATAVALLAVPDDRLECVVGLVYEESLSSEIVDRLIESFNREVMPFERIRKRYPVQTIPRTDLGKVKMGELSALVR